MRFHITKNKKIQTILYIFSISALSLASFWRIISFGFWKDDWFIIWSSLYSYSTYYHHPGTPIEFFILSHIFGLNPAPWMLFGIILRIFASYFVGLFIFHLTKSKLAGFLAGIFFACSYVGLETIYFPSTHVSPISGIPILLSLIYLIKTLQEKKVFIKKFLFFFCIAFILDPARIIPVLFLLPFLYLLLIPTKESLFVKKFLLKFYLIFAFIGIPILGIWFISFPYHSLLDTLIQKSISNPLFIFTKIKLIGNFSASIANLFIGAFYNLLQDEHNTGVYNKIFGRIGFGIFLLSIASFIIFIKSKSKQAGYLAFFIFWAFIFYLPNFLSEPRAPMAGAHRYLFFSSIGSIGLIAYLIANINKRWLIIILSAVFIIANIYKANVILAWQSTYRSAIMIERMWQKVNDDVPKNELNDIFIFYGSQPWLNHSIGLSSNAPFMLERHMHGSPDTFPVMTTDRNIILNSLCYKRPQLPISHIYAWEVKPNGILLSKTQQYRKIYKEEAEKSGCKVIN